MISRQVLRLQMQLLLLLLEGRLGVEEQGAVHQGALQAGDWQGLAAGEEEAGAGVGEVRKWEGRVARDGQEWTSLKPRWGRHTGKVKVREGTLVGAGCSRHVESVSDEDKQSCVRGATMLAPASAIGT